MSILDGLNPEQRAAAQQTEGPVMIIAGAGAGKTRTLTYRIAYLLEQGADPFRILALTFTNKAAREMNERITHLVGPAARALWMGTFHSIFAKILRAEAPLLGYDKSFTIYDTDDSKALIKKIVKDFNLDPKQYKDSRILYRLSMAKNSLISAEYYVENGAYLEEDTAMRMPELGRIFVEYSNRLKQASIMDFDDLLFNTNVLFRDFPEVLLKYQRRFRYLMVDEYQDTNYAQYLIVKKLAAAHKNLCVVGDDSQSIYSFRGANIRNILNFEHDYPDAHRYKLEQNYRSSGHIVALSNSIIAHNKDRIPKEIWTDNETGNKVKLLCSASDIDEGNSVAGEIFHFKMNRQARPKDFAVLYRTNSQSKAIEDALRKYNIPYRIYGGLSFYRRKEIKDILSYFRWVVNPNDEEALLRCINNPARGVGDTT
ncbi:MAG: UvrD-helicase domain-containing protein, partial [Bacteroidales bacterium]|nr:UvrD-helicase domain-containing protein [Bacteroidales bacterium]